MGLNSFPKGTSRIQSHISTLSGTHTSTKEAADHTITMSSYIILLVTIIAMGAAAWLFGLLGSAPKATTKSSSATKSSSSAPIGSRTAAADPTPPEQDQHNDTADAREEDADEYVKVDAAKVAQEMEEEERTRESPRSNDSPTLAGASNAKNDSHFGGKFDRPAEDQEDNGHGAARVGAEQMRDEQQEEEEERVEEEEATSAAPAVDEEDAIKEPALASTPAASQQEAVQEEQGVGNLPVTFTADDVDHVGGDAAELSSPSSIQHDDDDDPTNISGSPSSTGAKKKKSKRKGHV